jgi:hypothetical protein
LHPFTVAFTVWASKPFKPSNQPKKMKTWQRTGTQGLLKHRGGGYYARFFPYGKTKFVPLGTTVMVFSDRSGSRWE